MSLSRVFCAAEKLPGFCTRITQPWVTIVLPRHHHLLTYFQLGTESDGM
jgi:hypothetical protein